jgi:hypothetical protein
VTLGERSGILLEVVVGPQVDQVVRQRLRFGHDDLGRSGELGGSPPAGNVPRRRPASGPPSFACWPGKRGTLGINGCTAMDQTALMRVLQKARFSHGICPACLEKTKERLRK